MDTVAVRPRLDLRWDVIQSRAPQLVGSRATKAEALELAEWAAKRLGRCVLQVYGIDGATIEETRAFEGAPRPASTAH